MTSVRLRTVFYLALYVPLALLAAVAVGGKFLGGGADVFGVPLLALWIAPAALAILARAAFRRTRPELLGAGIALLALAVTAASLPALQRAGNRLFWHTRQEALDGFVRDLLAYGRIQSMDSGIRSTKQVNGVSLGLSADALDAVLRGAEANDALDLALREAGVDRAAYSDFRRRLIDMKLLEVTVERGFVAFVYDGFLDNLEGYLWVPPGQRPPEAPDPVARCQLVSLTALGGGWFYFTTT